MIAIDTDVLAVHHIFHNDPRYATTRDFFARIEGRPRAITVFNLLELSGLFASASRALESKAVFDKYLRAANVMILFPVLKAGDTRHFWQVVTFECLDRIQKGMRLGDAAILWALETNQEVDTFVTWNTKHFKGKTPLKVLTPSELL
jgi:predicted nucleic acid-binding protein